MIVPKDAEIASEGINAPNVDLELPSGQDGAGIGEDGEYIDPQLLQLQEDSEVSSF